MSESELERRIYELFRAFLERAERERRWNVFEDVPWSALAVRRGGSEGEGADLALCAETFYSIESFLPDFVEACTPVVRGSVGISFFLSSWAYDKARHQVALREWLLASKQRTSEELALLERDVRKVRWECPFSTTRQMVFYGAVQEMATFVTYAKHRELARRAHDECLRTIYDFVARDEIAHARFLESVIRAMLDADREGTIADMAVVLDRFVTPGRVLLRDYDLRMEKVRAAGLDRDVFIQRVYVPLLKHLGVTRRELTVARARLERGRRQVGPGVSGERSFESELLTVAS